MKKNGQMALMQMKNTKIGTSWTQRKKVFIIVDHPSPVGECDVGFWWWCWVRVLPVSSCLSSVSVHWKEIRDSPMLICRRNKWKRWTNVPMIWREWQRRTANNRSMSRRIRWRNGCRSKPLIYYRIPYTVYCSLSILVIVWLSVPVHYTLYCKMSLLQKSVNPGIHYTL